MDKYEYKLKTEQMLKLMKNGAYNRAAEIADSIDWKRVRNINMLLNVSNIYENIRDYRKSFGVLRSAYHRTEGSRKILYRLCTLAIKVGNLEEAIDYYDEYVQAAPKDPNQYILRYRLLRARRAPIEQQIRALEQFKKAEYVEEWAYELAKRYEEAGMTAECLEECDDLILWFSEGKYVYKAMELKMRYKPLTPLQQEKYDRRLEEAEKFSGRSEEKLIDLGRIKAEEEEKRRREQEEAVRYTEDMLERSEQITEPENVEFSEEKVAEQLKKAEPPKKKLGDTMELGEAIQNLFHTEKEEELELSEEDAEEYEEDVEELAEEDAEPVEADDQESTGEDDCSDLAEALEEIESLSDLELLGQVTEEEPVEEIIEETIETKVREPEVAEEAEKEDMEKESIKLEETEIKEDERIDEPIDDILDIDDILAEWEAAEGGVEPEEAPEVNEEDVEQIERRPKSPILSPDIQRMIDEIEGVIPEEESEEIPVHTSTSVEPLENKEEAAEEFGMESEELTLEVDSAEDYEDLLTEDAAEELEEEFEEELDYDDDYESIAAGLQEEFKPTLSDEPDDREIPDEEPVESDILSSTTPLSRKETAKLIATGKTAPLPMDEIADALSISDTGFLVHSRYDLSGQGAKRAGLTEEQKKLFSYFVPVRGMSEQLVDVLEQDRNCTNRRGTSNTGNLLIVGNKGNGKTVLAVDVVKAIQKQRKIRQGRVAIITGEALNKKKISDIIAKLYGGALIIEKAGKLSERTVAKLNKAMEKDTGEMLIVLEEQRKPLDRVLSSNREFRKKFTSRLEVPIFVNDELVTFGQTYAQENGYRIDEMGILALYSRIDALQREDHAVTVAEVKDIMDEAMAHSQKVSAKKLVKRVLGKNTDDADRIILTEKDFNI